VGEHEADGRAAIAVPWDRSKYPADWEERRARVLERSGGQCECTGECGLHPDRGNGPRRCVEQNGHKAKWAKGKVVLTTAHLDEDGPLDCPDDRLKAMCQRCHLRMDMRMHRRNASATRVRKIEEAGQRRLLP
jgi:hypothetical protein